MATYELNKKQFVTFLEYTWNNHLPEWKENLFGSILAYEEGRTFSEGWNYCESTLDIRIVATRERVYKWEYITTSGTLLKTSFDAAYGQESYTVTIPDERDQPGRTAHSDMQAVLAGHAYWSWSEQQDGSNPDAIAAAAFFQGVTVEELLESRKKEEEEREEKKENRRQFYPSNPDSDYEEFEGIITDDSIES